MKSDYSIGEIVRYKLTGEKLLISRIIPTVGHDKYECRRADLTLTSFLWPWEIESIEEETT